jgi:hypothetical protein
VNITAVISFVSLKVKLIRIYLLEPQLSPLIAAIVTVLLLGSFGGELFIDSFVSYAYKVKGSETDSRAYMSNMISEKNKIRAVYNVGGSGLMRALYDDVELDGMNTDLAFHNFSYSGQTTAESLMIIKELPLKQGDVVVLHTSISRINRTEPKATRVCYPFIYTINLGWC